MSKLEQIAKLPGYEDIKILKPPVYKWRLYMDADNSFACMKESAPNWFHRLMQRLILGFRWERL
jgi:hypothetical protein